MNLLNPKFRKRPFTRSLCSLKALVEKPSGATSTLLSSPNNRGSKK